MPSGTHYNLNIIGVPNDKTAPLTDTSGHVIFAKLYGKNTITLVPGTTFAVLDANGTDKNGAKFMMPTTVATSYTVWVRALGKPGGSSDMTTCYTDMDGYSYCLGNVINIARKNGKPVSTNVSADLLNVVVCTQFDASGACIATTEIPIFSDITLGYYWSYDNNGLRLAQLRFYPNK